MTAEAQTVTGQDYASGFETLDSEIELDSLPVEGSIPEWLAGSLVRNGPAKYEAGERRMRHWFDGLAMLHRFSFAGGSVSYANRFLRTNAYREAERGQISYREFATDPCRSIWKRATTMFRPGFSDNCNVNLARLGDEYIAMTETPLPVAFDPETLDALGVAYKPPGLHATAHPHFDRDSGELLAYVTNFGPRSEYRLYAQRDRSHQRRIGSHRVSEPSYMHSFAMTERYLVLVTFPLVVNPLQLAFSGRPFIENYRWKPELGTTFLVFDRADGRLVRECRTGPCFSFHHINAFERGSEIVIDMAAYEDASIVDSLYLDRVRSDPPSGNALARPVRYRIAPDRDEVVEEVLSDAIIELPQIDYGERNGRPYRFFYGIGAHQDGDSPDFVDRLLKVDLETGEELSWFEQGSYPGEPVFVPSPEPDRAEDQGVLLSVVLDSRGSSSFLLVLDARTLTEIGRAQVPHHIPFGFHGQFFD
jgi:carotenoid cleavage dioxygenase-like enzyme